MRLGIAAMVLGSGACQATNAVHVDPLELDDRADPADEAFAPPRELGPSAGAAPVCPTFSPGREAGRVVHDAIIEASGVAASAVHPVLWVHNDSGDQPRLFALGHDGAHRGTYELATAEAFDWEDIAVGPGPRADHSYLYVGDIGDNGEIRDHIIVYRVPEPTQIRTGPTVLEDVEAIELHYPVQPANAETLMIDPIDGDLYVVAKSWDDAKVFRARAPVESSARLEEVALLSVGPQLAAGLITGGDISPDGSEILLRTPTTAMVFSRSPTEPLLAAFARPACVVPSQPELQGEAIAFVDSAYVTLSEGSEQPLWRFDRAATPLLAALDGG